jgi:hypothetical protein
MGARSQAKDQNPRVGIAESGHRPSPILPVAVRPPFLARDLLAVYHEPRAALTGNHFTIKFIEP